VNLLWAFLAGAAASCLAGLVARPILGRLGAVDRPNQRSSHDVQVTRGGGLAVLAAAAVVGCLAAPLASTPGAPLIGLAVLVLAAVSFMDDLRSLPQAVRLAVHAGAAVAALCAVRLSAPAATQAPFPLCAAVIGFLWITGYTNAFNFMDGINGLAGMQVVTTGVGTALVALAAGGNIRDPAIVFSVVLAGAGAGFLPHNYPRARMFLGDVGSASLGFLLAVLAFWLAHELGWWLLGAFALLHANFVLDTAVTLGRRIVKGDKWLEPHREHFYQLLVRSGKSHAFVTGCEALLQVVVIVVVWSAVPRGWSWRFAAAGLVCLIWATFFAYAGLRFRRSQAAA
jgi:UDP-N-acetylmuramyl pentapeptide phosphotransferase/UDP-N-acetylglucosamine-1-phosphate transferase